MNTTEWTQLSGEAGGSAAGGAWIARGSGGTQDYYQTFTAVAADRASERLTTEQTTPSSFGTGIRPVVARLRRMRRCSPAAEGRWTTATVEEIRYSITNVRTGPFFAGGNESLGAVFGRASFVPREALTVVAGLRADFWESTPDDAALPTHTANFLSPRASAAYTLTDEASLHAAVYRAHRTPTLNELHRGFRVGNIVTNPNPQLDPGDVDRLRGRLPVHARRNRLRPRHRVLERAGRRDHQRHHREHAGADHAAAAEHRHRARRRHRARSRRALRTIAGPSAASSASRARRSSTRRRSRRSKAIACPRCRRSSSAATRTYVDPRGFTGAVQARVFGSQFDDDLNEFELDGFGVVDVSATQELLRGLHVFAAVENLFDADYDVGRTPIRTIGWPRTFRIGVRVFLP